MRLFQGNRPKSGVSCLFMNQERLYVPVPGTPTSITGTGQCSPRIGENWKIDDNMK
jgi:hypothetical protein